MTPYAHHIAVIRRLLRAGALPRAEKVLDKIPPEDIGSVMAQLPELEARPLSQLLMSPGRYQKTLKSVPQSGWASIVAPLNDEEMQRILDRLGSRRLPELLAVLTPERVARLGREAVEPKLLSSNVSSVMGAPGVALPMETTAQAAIDAIRASGRGSELFYLYTVDSDERLAGVVPLRRLVTAQADASLSSLLTPNPISVGFEAPAVEAARLLGVHGFLALPVVDGVGNLVGVVNTDDVFELMADVAVDTDEPVEEDSGQVSKDPDRPSTWSQWFPFLNPRRVRRRVSAKAAFVGVTLLMAGNSLI